MLENPISTIVESNRTRKDFVAGEVLSCDLVFFKSRCDLIVANRQGDELADVASKIYTRDPFRRD